MSFIRKHWLLISVIGLVLIAAIKLTGPAGTDIGFTQRLDSIIPADKNNFDFTKTVISLSALVDPGMDTAWTEKELDKMAGALKSEIGQEGNPQKIIDAFNNYFFTMQGFVFDNNFTNAEKMGVNPPLEEIINFHSIERVLKRKQGICLSITLIYLMLADKLRLPLYGVMIPGHIYVRYKEPGRAGINVETTFSGGEFYGYMDKIALLDPDMICYGREMDKYSVLGAYLLNIGNFFLSTGRYGKAESVFKKSVEVLPNAAEGYFNMGILYETINKNSLAEINYIKSLELLPGNGFAHYRLGAIYLHEQRFTKAQEELEDAIKTKSGGTDAVELLKKAKNKDGS